MFKKKWEERSKETTYGKTAPRGPFVIIENAPSVVIRVARKSLSGVM